MISVKVGYLFKLELTHSGSFPVKSDRAFRVEMTALDKHSEIDADEWEEKRYALKRMLSEHQSLSEEPG